MLAMNIATTGNDEWLEYEEAYRGRDELFYMAYYHGRQFEISYDDDLGRLAMKGNVPEELKPREEDICAFFEAHANGFWEV